VQSEKCERCKTSKPVQEEREQSQASVFHVSRKGCLDVSLHTDLR
jgi:hypothetical protein